MAPLRKDGISSHTISCACFQLLVLGVAGKDDEFKELLDSVPLDKVELLIICQKILVNQVNKQAVCGGSTLLQDLARLGKTSAVVALLHHGYHHHDDDGDGDYDYDDDDDGDDNGDDDDDGGWEKHQRWLPCFSTGIITN